MIGSIQAQYQYHYFQTAGMDILPLRRAKSPAFQPQHPQLFRTGQPQGTIDMNLRPEFKAEQGKNDIRNYFLPVPKSNASNHVFSNSLPPAKVPVSLDPSREINGAAKCRAPGLSSSSNSPAESEKSIPETHRSVQSVRETLIRSHKHAKSAVLPNFDPFFGGEQYSHSTSPMAPRVTNVVRHSLVPKPLKMIMPPFLAKEPRSPSQFTSSPSSVGDPDSASLDGERREALSFKQTYSSVNSRSHSIDGPISPLIALRDHSPNPLRHSSDRPATLRSSTAPTVWEPRSTDSVIYFLPKISPTSDSSADEREPLVRTNFSKPMNKALIGGAIDGRSQAVNVALVESTRLNQRMETLEEKAGFVSPGMRIRFVSTIRIRH